ncbi:MAG: cell division protein SepF [Erysipelotrichaceae bacterium]|nr:cell division protein SepF [Erysipelotrichaceae bacterium]
MGIFDKLKDMVAPEVEEEEDLLEQSTLLETKPISKYEEPKTKVSNINANTKMVLFEPRSFEEAEEIARHLKQRRACVVNLHKLSKEYAQRTIDFLTGAVFALDGTIQKIAHNAILLTPDSIGVEGEIDFDNYNN